MMGNATFSTVHVIMSKAAHRYRPRIEQFAISHRNEIEFVFAAVGAG